MSMLPFEKPYKTCGCEKFCFAALNHLQSCLYLLLLLTKFSRDDGDGDDDNAKN